MNYKDKYVSLQKQHQKLIEENFKLQKKLSETQKLLDEYKGLLEQSIISAKTKKVVETKKTTEVKE